MKKFSIAFIMLSIISFSFVAPVKQQASTPIRYDDSKTGSYVYFNQCTNENVEVTFRSDYSFRGAINGQRINFRVLYNEHHQGVGQTSGTRYVGQVNESDTQSASLTNGAYIYSMNVHVRMVAPGAANNFSSVSTLRYSFNSNGQGSASRTQEGFECQ